MNNSGADIVIYSFLGDSLALGPHWLYDPAEIRNRFGSIDTLHAPASSYHPGKATGDFTHYGDQALLLLRSISDFNGFDLRHFAETWRAYWENPATFSYQDGATRTTLANLKAGKPISAAASASEDLGGVARSAPLFLLKWESDDALIDATRQLAAFTHGNPMVADAAEFFTRATLLTTRGSTFADALENAAKSHQGTAPIAKWLAAARLSASSDLDDSAALDAHGLSCHAPDALKGVCHLLLRHPSAPVAALTANANAGGDSAARGMILGMMLGAVFPVTTLPQPWRDGMKAHDEILSLIRKIS